jgi:hypothetical protein
MHAMLTDHVQNRELRSHVVYAHYQRHARVDFAAAQHA